MKKNKEHLENELLKAYIKNRLKKYDEYFELPIHIYKIPEEQGLPFANDSCNGFCPECERILHCETYRETKDAWDRFCS